MRRTLSSLPSLLGAALVALVSVYLAGPGVQADEPRRLALVGGTVIDATGAPPVRDSVVLIEGERIAAIGRRERVQVPAAAEVVDVGGKWLIPGLVDAHIHFFQSGGLYARPDILDLRGARPYPEEIARTKAKIPETLARYLASGITAVVDVGGPMWTFAVRERARDTLLAPRVALTGPLLGTHAPPELAGPDPPVIEIDSVSRARAEVRRILARKPDLIKIWFVRRGRDIAEDIGWVRAVVDESHAAGVPVVVHATEPRAAKAVIRAGVDVLAHGVADGAVDRELLDLMAARDVIYTTTLGVRPRYYEVFGRQVRFAEIERRLGDREALASLEAHEASELMEALGRLFPVEPTVVENLIRVRDAGITIAAGSDAGNVGTLHGPGLHREMELMAAAGLGPEEVLIAATRGGAAVMGRAGDLGTLEPGKLADILVLDADPLADVRNLGRIDRIVKGGVVLAPEDILHAGAEGRRN